MVCFGMSDAPINLPDETEALKALVVSLQTELRAHSLVIQALRIQIARLKKQKFGASSEKIQREIEQLELALEGLEIAQAEKNTAPAQDGAQIGALRSGAIPPNVASPNSPDDWTVNWGFNSMHAGGLNVCFADGTVRWVSNGISLTTHRALSTIAGSETLASDAP